MHKAEMEAVKVKYGSEGTIKILREETKFKQTDNPQKSEKAAGEAVNGNVYATTKLPEKAKAEGAEGPTSLPKYENNVKWWLLVLCIACCTYLQEFWLRKIVVVHLLMKITRYSLDTSIISVVFLVRKELDTHPGGNLTDNITGDCKEFRTPRAFAMVLARVLPLWHSIDSSLGTILQNIRCKMDLYNRHYSIRDWTCTL